MKKKISAGTAKLYGSQHERVGDAGAASILIDPMTCILKEIQHNPVMEVGNAEAILCSLFTVKWKNAVNIMQLPQHCQGGSYCYYIRQKTDKLGNKKNKNAEENIKSEKSLLNIQTLLRSYFQLFQALYRCRFLQIVISGCTANLFYLN